VRRLASGELRFFRPDGRPLVDAPEAPRKGAEPLRGLEEQLATCGIEIDSAAGLPSWDGSPLDLAWAVNCLRAVGRGTALVPPS
jgi:hypothetical protein